jgi:Aspartyl protease
MQRRPILCLVLLLTLSVVADADDRLPFHTKINHQPVQLILDTGAEYSVLFRSAAKRLGLKVTKLEWKEPLPAGSIPVDQAEECMLDTSAGSEKFRFGVIDDPPIVKPGIDGVISWHSLSNFVLEVDLEQPAWKFSKDVPSDLKVGRSGSLCQTRDC